MSSGKRQRQQEMRRRVAAAQAEQRRADRSQRLVLGAGSVAAVVVLVGLIVLLVVHHDLARAPAPPPRPCGPPPPPDFGRTPCPTGDGSRPTKITFTSAPKQCIDPTRPLRGQRSRPASATSPSTLDAARRPGHGEQLRRPGRVPLLRRHHLPPGDPRLRGRRAATPTASPLGPAAPGYTIADEFPTSLSDFTAGSVAMANTGAPHSGSRQFFIWVGPNPLPGPNYSLFGQVSSGHGHRRPRSSRPARPRGRPASPSRIAVGHHRPGRRSPAAEPPGRPPRPAVSEREGDRQALALGQRAGSVVAWRRRSEPVGRVHVPGRRARADHATLSVSSWTNGWFSTCRR